MGVETAVGEISSLIGGSSSLIGEFIGETHRVLEHTQTHPPRNQYQKVPIYLWVAEEATETRQRAQKAALFPFGLPAPHNATMQLCGLPRPGEYLRLHLLCRDKKI